MDKLYQEPLLYRRQFLITPKEIENNLFSNWNTFPLGNSFFVYTHKDLSLTQVKSRNYCLTLAGFMIDSNNLLTSDSEILNYLLNEIEEGKDIFTATESTGGRWILVVSNNENIFLFNDAMGFRQVYYHIDSNQNIWCSSQPNLLSEVSPLKLNESINNWLKTYTKNDSEYWLPGELTNYENLKKLLPNHCLDLKTGISRRFWPIKPIIEDDKNIVLKQVADLLQNSIRNASKRFNLSLPLSGGLDSRILLSCCKDLKKDIFIYTLLYPPNTIKSSDISIPDRMSKRLGF